MKFVLRAVVVLVVLVLFAGGLAFFFLDRIVATSIEKGTTYATGVETKVGQVQASLFRGQFAFDDLSIANPPGFRPEPFVHLGHASAAWDNGSVFSDALHMHEFLLDGVELSLERDGGKTNYGTILDNVERLSPKGAPSPAESSTSSRSLKIDRITIRHVKAGLHLAGVPLAAGSLHVEVPEIVVENFDSSGTTTEIVAKLTRVVIDAVLSSALKAGQGTFPDDLVKDLGGKLGGLTKGLDEQTKSLLQSVEKNAGGSVDKLLKDAGGLLKPK